MKKKLIVKLIFIFVGLVAVYGYDLANVAADEACDTTKNCSGNNVCSCTLTTGCDGCFIPSGSSGCGKCAKSGDLEIE